MNHRDRTAMTLGQFIRKRRTELGLTQEALAERVGDSVRQSDISRLEHDGVSLPRRSRLEHIASALEVSLGTLMRQTGWLDADDRDEEPSSKNDSRHVTAEVVGSPAVHPRLTDAPPINTDASVEQHAGALRADSERLNDALSRAAAVRNQTEDALRQAAIALNRARQLRNNQ